MVTGRGESSIQLKNSRMGRLNMAEFKHGEMDITTQTDTFDGFISFVTKSVVFLLALTVFMAIFLT